MQARRAQLSLGRLALLMAVSLLATARLGQAAALAPRLSLETMAREADLVVVGRSTTSTSRWFQGNLLTFAPIEVAEIWKGTQGAKVTVVLPGGMDSSGPIPLAQDVPGAPTLQPGEEVLLFLRRVDPLPAGLPPCYTILGFGQGKFSIRRQGGKAIASQNLSGVGLVDGSRVSPGALTERSLESLRDQLRSLFVPQSAAPQPPSDTRPQ
ncbi:MAG: hypothetical protein U0002_20955 [Thermoanaerobaculia bacterium]